eukprot:481522_1
MQKYWNLVHHTKFLNNNIKRYQNELLRIGHSFKTQHNMETHLKEKHYPVGTFHTAYVNQWPHGAHLNMSNAFNFCTTQSHISDKSEWVIPLQFQRKHNLSVNTLVDLFDISHKSNQHKPKWKHHNILPTKYNSFADSLGNNIPYLTRQETGEELLIWKNVHTNDSKVKNMEHILNTYQPDVIINDEPLKQNIFEKYLQSKNKSLNSEIIPTAMRYAIKNNHNILLPAISEQLHQNLILFAKYFDMFQLEMLYELQKPDVMQCIFELKNIAEQVLSGETLPCLMSVELARLVFRRLHPHECMYNGYKDEFIAFGIDNCVDAFPGKQNKKLLAILGEEHCDEVINRLIKEKPIENIEYNCINDQVMFGIERDEYENWPCYDKQLHLANDLKFVECFVADREWKVNPLKIVKMFLFGHCDRKCKNEKGKL